MRTMNEFLSYIRSLHIKLWVEENRLRYSAPQGTMTPALRAELLEHKTELISLLQANDLAKYFNLEPIHQVSRETDLPLSFAQQRLWFLNQLEGKASATYNMPAALRLTGKLNVEAFHKAVQKIVSRHESLRTTFQVRNGSPVQIIAPKLNVNLPIVDLQLLPQEQQLSQVQQLAYEEQLLPFDLVTGPLVRITLLSLAIQEHVLLSTMHHIISDGWSMGIFIQELNHLYQAFATGASSQLPDLPIQYADFAAWQRQWLSLEVLETQLNYWKQKLAFAPPILQLHTDRPNSSAKTSQGNTARLTINVDLTQNLKLLGQRSGATLFMTLLAAFATLLSRYSSLEDIVVGSPIANRNRNEIETLIGFFVNILPLRIDLLGNPNFLDLLNRVRQVALEAYSHQDLPFEKLVEELHPDRKLDRNPLVQVVFAFNNTSTNSLNLPELSWSQIKIDVETVRFDLELHLWEVESEINGYFLYNSHLFNAITVEKMVEHFQSILEAIITNPHQKVSEIPLLNPSERQYLLTEWNNKVEYSQLQYVHQLFENQVQNNPDAIAVVFAEQHLTYRDLNKRANKIAHYLQELGLKSSALVGICMERSLEMVYSILGVLKANAAYLPLDPTYPSERLRFMVSDSQMSILLTQEQLATKIVNTNVHVVCWDTERSLIYQQSEENPVTKVTGENVAYVIYTSGSTGQPKGVLVPHKGLLNLVFWHQQAFEINSKDRATQLAGVGFDASVWELWPYLTAGASVYLVKLDIVVSPVDLRDYLVFKNITVSFFPTPLAERVLCLTWPQNTALRIMLTGGDQLHQHPSAKLPFKLINNYGPTENTVVTTSGLVSVDEGNNTLPTIGRAISNVQVYILDSHLQPVPRGVIGELYIGGASLAQGYLNRPGLTAEKFIPNPFNSSEGERLYKTGDLARYLVNGEIEFIGRIDNQVKVRGFRIELEEIEAVLNQHPAVQQAVVMTHDSELDSKRLLSYIVPYPQDQSLETKLEKYQVEHVSEWQKLYNQTYKEVSTHQQDLTFNIVGWNSSYTGSPIPEAEMHDWVEDTVRRILDLQPKRVLEIGSGTGLILSRIAPHCLHYLGTDYSFQAIEYLHYLKNSLEGLENVTLLQKMANDFEGIEKETFDTVIINSVIQYFPNIEYLVEVLEGAVKVLGNGGSIFVGDIRNLSLLSAHHASVQLAQASDSLSQKQLLERIQQRINQESELVIDPAFFIALKQHLPQVSHVEIQLKRGRYHNELTKFRYNAVIYVGGEVSSTPEIPWLDWRSQKLMLSDIRQLLNQSKPEILGIRRIPNSRLQTEMKTLEWLNNASDENVEKFRSTLAQHSLDGIDPSDMWDISYKSGYYLDITLSDVDAIGCYDLVFRRFEETKFTHLRGLIFREEITTKKPWYSYANAPLKGKLTRNLIPQLRQFLQDKLPDYMVCNEFILLDALPLTSNGKVDRRALKILELEQVRPQFSDAFVAPRTPTEIRIANIWTEILNLPQVGIHNNFFEMGGHSLLATQVMSRLRDAFSIELPLRRLFESPTIAELSKHIETVSHNCQSQNVPALQPIVLNQEIPLSFAQQRLWLINQLEGATANYNIPVALHLTGNLDTNAFEMAVQEIVRRHEILRTTFPLVNGTPSQFIAPIVNVIVPIVELPKTEQFKRVQKLVQEQAERPFDLTTGPLLCVTLLRLGSQSHVLLVVMHHIICDEWSMSIFIRELSALYKAYSTKKPSPLAELPMQYADFAVWQRQWLSGEVLETQLSYWQKQLTGTPALLELHTDRPRPSRQTFGGNTVEFSLDLDLTQKLVALSQKLEVTLFMTLLAAFVTLLYRYSNQEDIVVGSPIANRNFSEIESLIGFFVNTLALRIDLQGNPTFSELLTRVRQIALEAYAHQELPFEQLVEALQPERNSSYSPIFQVMFVLQNALTETLELPELSLNPLKIENFTTKFDLNLSMSHKPEGLVGSWEYNTALFEVTTITRMVEHFQNLLVSIVAHPEQHLSELTLLSQSEHQQLLLEWNTQTEYPQSQCIHQLFEQQVAKTPNAIAVVFEEQQLTYRELDCRANQLARYLQALRVGKESLVGICVERSLEMLVGILAILKAGGAYVPLDPSYPQERLAYMLTDSQVRIILTQDQLMTNLPKCEGKIICLDTDWELISQESEEKLNSDVETSNLAYVIYTSGSTGKPKGVLIEHRNVVRLFCATQPSFNFNQSDVWTLFHSYAFDFSVWEIWGALLYGGRLIVVPYWISRSPQAFHELLSTEKVTVLNQTPSAFRQLMQSDQSLNTDRDMSLRLVIFGGEALDIQSLRPWFEKHGDHSPQLVNMYGITETTVHVTYRLVTITDLNSTGSMIGSPIPDLQVYVLDQHLQPLPIGVPGEMHIGGAGLARGYLNRPELTTEKFISHPFSHKEESRLYKTGDLVRYLPDGNIEYLGRIDLQVKIRGFRIELGEIEALLSQHPKVRETVVIAYEDQPGNKRLVAYIVPNQEKPTISELHSFLVDRVPNYMVPSAFVLLDTMPLTSNGKVNRKALPAPDILRSGMEEDFTAPRTPIEEILAAIWAEVLELEQVGVYDNFFAIGGDSIRAIQVVHEANKYNLQIIARDVFEYQTIYRLAQHINSCKYKETNLSIPLHLLEFPENTFELLPDGIEEVYPLAKMQEFMLHHYSNDHQKMGVYHCQQSFEIIDNNPSLSSFKKALEISVQKHPAFRTVFIVNNVKKTLQVVKKNLKFSIYEQDISNLESKQQENYIDDIVKQDRQNLFNTENPNEQLFRFWIFQKSHNRFEFLMSTHHAIEDGWGNIEFLKELYEFYSAIKRGEEIKLAPPIYVYKEFVALEKEIIKSIEASNFWNLRLSKHIYKPLHPLKNVVNEIEFIAEECMLDSEIIHGTQELCRTMRVSPKSNLFKYLP